MVKDDEKLDILATMAYFASIKKYAIQQIFKIKKPLSNDDLCRINIFYGTYFTYLVGLIDYLIKDKQLLAQIEVENVLGGTNNYFYVRNLRNAIIHRGEEIANRGVEIVNKLGLVCLRSPVVVAAPRNKENYSRFTNNLLQTVIICERLNYLFLNIITNNDLTNYPDETEETFKKEHEEDLYIPPYAKTPEMIKVSWQAYQSQVKELHKSNVKLKLSYFNTEYLFI